MIPVRRFHLQRDADATGISGTGRVAEGVRFPSGHCVIEWSHNVNSLGIFDNIDEIRFVHGHGGSTRIIWDDKEDGPSRCPECNGLAETPHDLRDCERVTLERLNTIRKNIRTISPGVAK